MYVTKWNTYFNFYGLGDGVSYTTYDMSPLPISKVTILYLVTSLTQFGREEAEQDFITVMTDQRRPGIPFEKSKPPKGTLSFVRDQVNPWAARGEFMIPMQVIRFIIYSV
jgi:hypothetical protein